MEAGGHEVLPGLVLGNGPFLEHRQDTELFPHGWEMTHLSGPLLGHQSYPWDPTLVPWSRVKASPPNTIHLLGNEDFKSVCHGGRGYQHLEHSTDELPQLERAGLCAWLPPYDPAFHCEKQRKLE